MKPALPLLLCLPLLANDTGINSGAHGPSPLGEFVGDESVIRMVEESIHIRFGKEESEVTCRFTFRSGKKEGDAKQVVGFPDFIDTETDTGSIREMQTFIDGMEGLRAGGAQDAARPPAFDLVDAGEGGVRLAEVPDARSAGTV